MENPQPNTNWSERQKNYEAEQQRRFDEFKKREPEYRAKLDQCPDLVKMLEKIEPGDRKYVIRDIVESIGRSPYKDRYKLELEELEYFKPEVVKEKLDRFREMMKQTDPEELIEFFQSLADIGFNQSGEGTSGDYGGSPPDYDVNVRLYIMRSIDKLLSKKQEN